MVLNLEKVLKYKSILSSIAETGHPIYSSLFFDFVNKEAYFSNSSFAGKVEIDVDDEGEDLLANVFIPVDKLLHLLSRDTKLVMDTTGTIHLSNGDTISLSTIHDPSYMPPTFDLSAEPSLASAVLTNYGETAKKIKQAIQFAPSDPDSPMYGVFFRGESIVGLEQSRMYEYTGNKGLPDGDFTVAMAKLMLACQNESEITIATTDSKVQMRVGTELVVQTGSPDNLDLIDIDDPDFRGNFEHDETVTLNREAVLAELAFLSPFLNQENHQRVKLTFDEDNVYLIVDEDDKVTTKIKDVTYSNYSEFEGEERWVSGNYLRLIASSFDTEEIKMKFSKDSVVMDFIAEGVDLHIVKVAFEDAP